MELTAAVEGATRSTLVRGHDTTAKGHIRFETALVYPDGTSIEVFLPHRDDLFDLKLTDFGQTMDWLTNLLIRPWLSKRRQAFLDEAIRVHGVQLNGGALELPLASLDDVPAGVLKLAQACFRVADLSFTRRQALQSTFAEEVEEVLGDLELSYKAGAELPAASGRAIRVDFLVHRKTLDAAILTLSSGNAGSAHAAGNEVFTKWFDLSTAGCPANRVTVFDDRYDVYRESDIARLQNLSAVVPASDRATLRQLVA